MASDGTAGQHASGVLRLQKLDARYANLASRKVDAPQHSQASRNQRQLQPSSRRRRSWQPQAGTCATRTWLPHHQVWGRRVTPGCIRVMPGTDRAASANVSKEGQSIRTESVISIRGIEATPWRTAHSCSSSASACVCTLVVCDITTVCQRLFTQAANECMRSATDEKKQT